tara:strand:+ start:3135 stop:3389 length:255 start_codon:yes stop_codon:yes gene_type:complete
MTQIYSDSSRETDPNALPDVEVFSVSELEVNYNLQNLDHADEHTITKAGWYWWSCFPGCLPDGEAFGPFSTEAEAIADAQDIQN